MDIKQYIKESHDYFVAAGSYVCPECEGLGHVETDDFMEDCLSCSGTGIDPDKNIGDRLMRVIEELGAANVAHREGRFADWKRHDNYMKRQLTKFSPIVAFNKYIKGTREDRIAMVFIRLFDLAGYLGLENLKLKSNRECGCENIGENLYYIIFMTSDVYYIRDQECFDEVLNLLLDFCQHNNIPIEKHIEARLAYNKMCLRTHGKKY